MTHAILIDADGAEEIEIFQGEEADQVEINGRLYFRERETVVFRHMPVPTSLKGVDEEWR